MSAQPGQRALRVLVVDDHQLFRTGLRELLEQEGFNVRDANGGNAALHLVPSFAPDVVLMDATMPGMCGIEATRRLRETTPTTAVLMLTGVATDELVLRALRAGASGYLLKDAELAQITAGIRSVAAGHSTLSPRVARVVVDHIRLSREVKVAAPDGLHLTEREREVLAAVARGLSNAEIADRLVVGEATVKTHVSSVFAKLGLRDRVEAVVFAYESGLIEPGRQRDGPGRDPRQGSEA